MPRRSGAHGQLSGGAGRQGCTQALQGAGRPPVLPPRPPLARDMVGRAQRGRRHGKHPLCAPGQRNTPRTGPRGSPPRPKGCEAHLGRWPVQLRPWEGIGGGGCLRQGLQVGQVALQGLGQHATLQAEAPLVWDALLRAPGKEREASGGPQAQCWLCPQGPQRAGGQQGCAGTQAPGQAARAGSEGPTRRSHRPRWCPVCTQAWCWDTGEPGERTLTYFLNSRPTTGGRDKPEWGVGQDLLSAGRTSAAERLPGQGGETGERWARHPLLWACLRQRPPLHSPPGAKEQAQRVRRSCSPTSRKRGTQGSAGHWLASQLTGR